MDLLGIVFPVPEKAERFIAPASTTGNDYLYDSNGNMTRDQNKGITGIRYDHLCLPEMVKKTGADSLVYTYDAGGRKLRQQVYGSKPK